MNEFQLLANADQRSIAGQGLIKTLRSGGGVRTWVQPGFELFFSFTRVQTWVQLGFELLEEFELFQGSENSILNLDLTWVLIGFHSTWIEPGLNLG